MHSRIRLTDPRRPLVRKSQLGNSSSLVLPSHGVIQETIECQKNQTPQLPKQMLSESSALVSAFVRRPADSAEYSPHKQQQTSRWFRHGRAAKCATATGMLTE